MSTRIKYTNEPIKAKVIRDFLPTPAELAFSEEEAKVALALSKKGVALPSTSRSTRKTRKRPAGC
ncbi:MAG: hypothetical protein ACYDC8_13385 [Gammaproteobacteria bacterium]